MKRVLQILGVVLALYVGFLGWMYAAMTSPPDVFAKRIAMLPAPAMMAVPFPPMWNAARGGKLQIGDVAPNFSLAGVEGAARGTLAEHRGARPVVLVFGSYT